MENRMRNKLVSSLLIALALVGAATLPSRADDDKFKSIVLFPVKVVGSCVGTVIGVPEGMVKDGVKGSMMSTEWTADKLGDKNGKYQTWAGALVGGPFGLVGGAAYGSFDGAVHGLKTGFNKPFSQESFTYKD
jgi:hypothetical protein